MRRTKPASALLLATLVVTLLALSAGLTIMNTRAARAATGEALRMTQARFAADRLLAIGLIELDSGEPSPSQGTLFEDARHGAVSRQDVAGLLDVNAASPERMATLMIALGVETREAQTLAERIADWRDEDDLRRTLGAEQNEYHNAHVEGPANRPFIVESEISLVLGVGPELSSCLARHLTVHSGASEVDRDRASPTLVQFFGPAPTHRELAATLGQVVILTAETAISEHAVFRKQEWVRLTGDPREPYLVHRALEETAPRIAPTASCGRAP